MRLPRVSEEDEREGIDISSLLDVLFILIIFFLATASFEAQERDHRVSLVGGDAAIPASQQSNTMIVNVYPDGRILLGSRSMDLATLEAELAAARRDRPEQDVLIRGDQAAMHGKVQDVMRICKRVGFPDPRIGYSALRAPAPEALP